MYCLQSFGTVRIFVGGARLVEGHFAAILPEVGLRIELCKSVEEPLGYCPPVPVSQALEKQYREVIERMQVATDNIVQEAQTHDLDMIAKLEVSEKQVAAMYR